MREIALTFNMRLADTGSDIPEILDFKSKCQLTESPSEKVTWEAWISGIKEKTNTVVPPEDEELPTWQQALQPLIQLVVDVLVKVVFTYIGLPSA